MEGSAPAGPGGPLCTPAPPMFGDFALPNTLPEGSVLGDTPAAEPNPILNFLATHNSQLPTVDPMLGVLRRLQQQPLPPTLSAIEGQRWIEVCPPAASHHEARVEGGELGRGGGARWGGNRGRQEGEGVEEGEWRGPWRPGQAASRGAGPWAWLSPTEKGGVLSWIWVAHRLACLGVRTLSPCTLHPAPHSPAYPASCIPQTVDHAPCRPCSLHLEPDLPLCYACPLHKQVIVMWHVPMTCCEDGVMCRLAPCANTCHDAVMLCSTQGCTQWPPAGRATWRKTGFGLICPGCRCRSACSNRWA